MKIRTNKNNCTMHWFIFWFAFILGWMENDGDVYVEHLLHSLNVDQNTSLLMSI
jgi:hypothetical protein